MIEELTKKLQSQLELFTVSIPGGVKISNDDPNIFLNMFQNNLQICSVTQHRRN